MHTEKREPPQTDIGYEVRDVNFKGIRTATVIFFAFAIGSAIVGYAIYFFVNPSRHAGVGPAIERQIPGDPNPLLQDNVTAKTDIMDMRQAEQSKLHGAPVSQENGTYRIPIDAAKALVVEGAAVQATASTPSSDPNFPHRELSAAESNVELPRGSGTAVTP